MKFKELYSVERSNFHGVFDNMIRDAATVLTKIVRKGQRLLGDYSHELAHLILRASKRTLHVSNLRMD